MRSITAFGFCVVAPLSRYTRGFPFTFVDRIGKSLRTFWTSNGCTGEPCTREPSGSAAGPRVSRRAVTAEVSRAVLFVMTAQVGDPEVLRQAVLRGHVFFQPAPDRLDLDPARDVG